MAIVAEGWSVVERPLACDCLADTGAPFTFLDFCAERVLIAGRRASQHPPPWTQSKPLQQWRFCNIFREWDRTTTWFRTYVRRPLSASEDVAFATIAFRWFNSIAAGERLLAAQLFTAWDPKRAVVALRDLRPVTGGAYCIRSPDGMPKLKGLIHAIDLVAQPHARTYLKLALRNADSLEEVWSELRQFKYLGPFMAYEVVTDLRWTELLDQARDVYAWCNVGPGAQRGLGWIWRDERDSLLRSDLSDLNACRILLGALAERLEDLTDAPVELREVEHALCEYDKYRRAWGGESLKRRYRYVGGNEHAGDGLPAAPGVEARA